MGVLGGLRPPNTPISFPLSREFPKPPKWEDSLKNFQTKNIRTFLLSNLPLVIMGLMGAGIIIIATNHFNAGVTPDSVSYISAASNLVNGKGYINYDGSPITIEPPMYPVILGIVSWVFKMDPLGSVRFVNALLLGLIIFLAGLLFKKHLKSSPSLVVLGTAYVLVSTALISVSYIVWTEPLFICFILLYFLFSEKYSEKSEMSSLILLSILTLLATLTRYMGLSLVFTSLFVILFFNPEKPGTKIRHLFIFIFVSILPITALLIRNFNLSGSFFGYNAGSWGIIPISQEAVNVYKTFRTIFNGIFYWYLPEQIAIPPLALILGFVMGFFVALELSSQKLREDGESVGGGATRTPSVPRFIELLPLEHAWNWKKISNLLQPYYLTLLFILIYLGALLAITGPVNLLESRYLSPVFVPITLLLLIFVDKELKPVFTRFFPKNTNLIIAAFTVVWFIYPITQMLKGVASQVKEGSYYTSRTWSTSETIDYLTHHRDLESECTLYSNGPDVIYLWTGLESQWSPSHFIGFGGNSLGNPDISLLKSSWPQESRACLVWFDNITWRNYIFPPESLMTIARLGKVTQFKDGKIYIFQKK
jgi:hypothetical protein